jgi:hypothetical protein
MGSGRLRFDRVRLDHLSFAQAGPLHRPEVQGRIAPVAPPIRREGGREAPAAAPAVDPCNRRRNVYLAERGRNLARLITASLAGLNQTAQRRT